jgi:hypothetical protein
MWRKCAGAVQEVGVMDRAGHLDDPIFLLREGAQYIVKVVLAAGCGRRWVPLPVAGADLLHISMADSSSTFLEVRLLHPLLTFIISLFTFSFHMGMGSMRLAFACLLL